MKFLLLKDLCNVIKGVTGISKAIPGEFPLVVTSEERSSHNEFQFNTNAVIIPLVSSTGHGHASLKRIHYQEGKFAVGSILCAVIPKDEEVLNAEFLYHYLSLNKEKELVSRMKGMANVTLPMKEIEKIPIPVLSISEQRKFVKFYSSVKSNSNNISTELSNQLSLISQLRQAFLREAMQGKLVSNETSDGKTGHQLLEEIRLEKERLVKEKKIKKQKPLPPISEKEIPFEIPENWAWCRLGEICNYGSSKKIEPADIDAETWSLDLEDIEKKSSRLLEKVRYKDRKSTSTKSVFVAGQVLYSKLRPNLDKVLVADENGVCTTEIIPIELYGNINSKFLRFYLKNNQFLDYVINSTKGMKMPRVGIEEVRSAYFPLPPLEIQERVAAKLDELMQYCDGLEESVKQSQSQNDLLLQQVLREALEGKSEKAAKALLVTNTDKPAKSTKKYQMNDMAILAGHIINTLSTDNRKDFGRVKLQKMLHLLQYHCELDLPLTYQKNVAGPYTRDLERQIEKKLKQLRFFDIQKIPQHNYDMVSYMPLSSAKELDRLFVNEFGEDMNSIDNLLGKFRSATTSFCERVSTMYAVWNNRILANEPITDDLLKTDFLNWDEGKKKFASQLDDTLDWMRRNGIVPRGVGKVI